MLVLIILAAWFYWALFTPKTEIADKIKQTIQEQEKLADLFFKKVTFEEVSASIKYWQLNAESAMINKDQEIATLKQADGVFYKNGKAVLKFRSPAAIWDMKKKEIFLDTPLGYDVALEKNISRIIASVKQNPLSVFNFPKLFGQRQGYWFQARNLSWKLSDQQLVCTGGIRLNKGEITGTAKKLVSDVALEKVRLEGEPRITIQLEKDSPVTIEADAFEVNSVDDVVTAQGNPRVTWNLAKVTALSAKYLQSQQNIQLNGNVLADYTDIHAAADAADYFPQTQNIFLKGNAHAEQGENNLKGDKIIISLRDKKISLAGRSKVIITEEKLKK